MARKAREKSATGVYAVILRSADNIFEKEDMRDEFAQCAEKYLGSGLMGIRFCHSRVNMLVKESEKGISMDMKPLITSFARTYNRTAQTEGKVFTDRFKSVPIESPEHEAECIGFLNGGGSVFPYDTAAAARRAVKKEKAVPEPEKKEEKPPVRQRNKMPTWLL